MKAAYPSRLVFAALFLVLFNIGEPIQSQEPLGSLVEPNAVSPDTFSGSPTINISPFEDASFSIPYSNRPLANPDVPAAAISSPQDAPQIPPGNLPIPENFPEAINEPMIDWINWSAWESSVELGINGSSGNSESFNVSSGFDLLRATKMTETRVDFNYINNKSNDVLVAHNARLTIDWEKKFGEELGQRFAPGRWSWFIKNTYFYDDFQAFDLRIALNSGVGYKFVENDVQMIKGRFGAGGSRELGGVNDEWIPEALFGLDYRRQLSKRQKLNLTLDFFPSWENFSDYRVVSDFSWEYLLDEETNLSLKFNVNDQYDSTPDGGAVANDVFYSLLLLWKF